MKNWAMFLAVQVSLLTAILVVGCAQPNKQVYYGTWTNEKGHYQKVVHTPDGVVQNYTLTSDTAPVEQANVQIVSCWSDSEGSVWFKTEGTITEGPHKNTVPKVQTLEKVSKDGTFLRGHGERSCGVQPQELSDQD